MSILKVPEKSNPSQGADLTGSGPASDAEIAAHIARSTGPSGPNSEYVLKLAQALRDINEHDEHVFAIERELLKHLDR